MGSHALKFIHKNWTDADIDKALKEIETDIRALEKVPVKIVINLEGFNHEFENTNDPRQRMIFHHIKKRQ